MYIIEIDSVFEVLPILIFFSLICFYSMDCTLFFLQRDRFIINKGHRILERVGGKGEDAKTPAAIKAFAASWNREMFARS